MIKYYMESYKLSSKGQKCYLQVAGHSQPCRGSVAGDPREASPLMRKERLMRQFVPSDLVGSRQPHFLSWVVKWADQHKHAKAPSRLKKPQGMMMNLKNMKKLKRINNKHNHPCHSPHYNMHSSPPHQLLLHGSDQIPWIVPWSCSNRKYR